MAKIKRGSLTATLFYIGDNMNLRQLQKLKRELLKELEGYKRVLESPVLKLEGKTRTLYEERVKRCQNQIDEVDNELLRKRKRWA